MEATNKRNGRFMEQDRELAFVILRALAIGNTRRADAVGTSRMSYRS